MAIQTDPPRPAKIGTAEPAKAGTAKPANALTSLLLDVAVPIGSYYLLSGLGVGLVPALACSSIVPAARALWGVVVRRRWNGLALLVLVVNAVSLALSFTTGDARFVIAKDSGVSSVVGLVVLVSVFAGRPLMTAAMRPWITRGDPEKEAAWERLATGSPRFRVLERRFSAIWGSAFLLECAVRVLGAYTLPVTTMVWLGTVMMTGFLILATLVGGALAAGPLEGLVAAEAGNTHCPRKAANARRGESEPETTPSC